MTAAEDGPELAPPPWPGPGLYTLRAWVEVDVALERDVVIDATHALITDAAAKAFGSGLYQWVGEALTADGRDPEGLGVLLDDDALAERVLEHVRARMRDDDEAPDLPDEEYGWFAYSPDDPTGSRERFRRAVRRRRRNARDALMAPRRPRVAGPRDR